MRAALFLGLLVLCGSANGYKYPYREFWEVGTYSDAREYKINGW